MENLVNLFDNPTTLRNPEHLIGRRLILGRIFGMLTNKQSLELVGPRRIGKTSLLTSLQSPAIQQEFHFAGDQFFFVTLDLQQISLDTRGDFLEFMYLTIREHAETLE